MANGVGRIAIGALMAIVGAIAGFVYRGIADNRDIADSAALVLQSRAETRDLKAQLATFNVQVAVLKNQLANAKGALDSVVPSENTYLLGVNESVVAADGRLNIALVGAPTNEAVNLNINGKQYVVAAGELIKIADASTNCDVRVRAFDMFKAQVMATCKDAK